MGKIFFILYTALLLACSSGEEDPVNDYTGAPQRNFDNVAIGAGGYIYVQKGELGNTFFKFDTIGLYSDIADQIEYEAYYYLDNSTTTSSISIELSKPDPATPIISEEIFTWSAGSLTQDANTLDYSSLTATIANSTIYNNDHKVSFMLYYYNNPSDIGNISKAKIYCYKGFNDGKGKYTVEVVGRNIGNGNEGDMDPHAPYV